MLNILNPSELIRVGGAVVVINSAVRKVASTFQNNSALHGGAMVANKTNRNGGAILTIDSEITVLFGYSLIANNFCYDKVTGSADTTENQCCITSLMTAA